MAAASGAARSAWRSRARWAGPRTRRSAGTGSRTRWAWRPWGWGGGWGGGGGGGGGCRGGWRGRRGRGGRPQPGAAEANPRVNNGGAEPVEATTAQAPVSTPTEPAADKPSDTGSEA